MFLSRPKVRDSLEPSAPTLFRAAAVSFRAGVRGGSARISQPLSTVLLTALIAAIAGVLIVFVVRGEYARKESVAGFLEPLRGVVRIHPQRSGIITEMLVHDGQTVARNDLLFKVAVPQTMADGGDADGTLLTNLAQERAALAQALAREHERTESARKSHAARAAAFVRELAELGELEDLQIRQRRLADIQLDALRRLYERGALPALQWLNVESQHLAAQEKLQTTRELISRTQGDLTALEGAAAASRYEAADRLTALSAQLLALERARVEVESRRNFAVRAPMAGRVVAIQQKVGAPAAPAQVVLTIVPERSPLVGRLLIPTRAIGFVRPGQRIALRFDAFPHQHFGTHPGTLENVSGSVLFDGDSFGPLQVSQPAYPATVVIPKQTIAADGNDVPLQSGMLLQADIILERRTILEWLMQPLLTLRGRN
jgi:membrane fusion protein